MHFKYTSQSTTASFCVSCKNYHWKYFKTLTLKVKVSDHGTNVTHFVSFTLHVINKYCVHETFNKFKQRLKICSPLVSVPSYLNSRFYILPGHHCVRLEQIFTRLTTSTLKAETTGYLEASNR
jgi:hypothetical protein